MITLPAENPAELKAFGPRGLAWYRLDYPEGTPEVDSQLAAMFRILGDTGDALAPLPGDERASLLCSLATTLLRANYHRGRVDFLVGKLAERHRLVGMVKCGDLLARYAVYEASSLLGAARSAVDEVVYIAARRAGITEEKAKRKTGSRPCSSRGRRRPTTSLRCGCSGPGPTGSTS